MPDQSLPFNSIYRHGLVRTAVCLPEVEIAQPKVNLERTLALARQAAEQHAVLALFPELGLSAYSNDDLVFQDALLDGVEEALAGLMEASGELDMVLIVGAPLRHAGKLFNCAVVLAAGRLLGVVPKSYLPNYREFYEKRHFTSGRKEVSQTIRLFDDDIPFGADLLFEAEGRRDFTLHVEVCEDLWVPIPPSTWAALAGATVLANLSASNITIGKAAYRRQLCASQSAKCVAAYLYAAAAPGESTTDLAWDGHGMVWENGTLLAESERFPKGGQLITADVDLERLRQERARMTSLNDCAADYPEHVGALRRIQFPFEPITAEVPLERAVPRFPYVPSEPESLDERCEEAYNIQIQGLTQRLRATGIERVVIGVSGGLDSTQALIVAVEAMDRLDLPRSHILGYSLPGFATTERTRENALQLMDALGVTAEEIDIRPSCEQMLRDLDHPFARGEKVYDITFENVQAGARTSHLFRLANQHGGLVVGTSDLSEISLGWNTYGVGDQMSHYAVNASVPKTLIRHLIAWIVRTGRVSSSVRDVLDSILETVISPELVPGDGAGEEGGQPTQHTESVVGPFELQDLHLYLLSRYGFRPSKVAFLAHHAWGERERGDWPPTLPREEQREYALADIKRWLEVFLLRFIQSSQFKRSAMPNAPKVGSGGSLSPRSDWRAPSDVSAETWLEELRRNVP
jgi:NAD+ synthase (glutamine-hydrolysing)